MKYIITLLFLVFSASVLNARSVKVSFLINFQTQLVSIITIDSKTKDQKVIKILLDSVSISVSKNKEALLKISKYLDEVQGGNVNYSWYKKDVIQIVNIIRYYESAFVWSNYQVSRHTDEEMENGFIHTYYFYKQDKDINNSSENQKILH